MNESRDKWYGMADDKGRILIARRKNGYTLLWVDINKSPDEHNRPISLILKSAAEQHGFNPLGTFYTVGRIEGGQLRRAYEHFKQLAQSSA
jgi:hypothetical protein